jgi:predicted DNA-binding transcriptional regulator YafY
MVFNGTFYLIGLCHVREEVRIFALDRIKMLSQTDERFEIPEDFDLENFLKPSFGVFQGEPVKVKIWFSADIAGYIKEKIWHESQEIHSQDDGSFIFDAEVAGTDEIKFWVMNWGSHALVLEPESLRNEIRAEAEVMVKKYSEGFKEEERPQTA